MAKKKEESGVVVEESAVVNDTPTVEEKPAVKEVEIKTSKKESVKAPKMPIEKYFRTVDPPIHIYTRAALGVQFRGIMKTEAEWAKELEEYTRGV